MSAVARVVGVLLLGAAYAALLTAALSAIVGLMLTGRK